MSSQNLAPAIEKALSAVIDMKIVSGLHVDQGRVVFAIEVDPEKGAALEPLRQKAQAAVEAVPGVTEVTAVLTAERAPPPAMTVKGPRAGAGGQPAFSHKISSNPVAPGVRHIVAVASGKGGVGKSTVANNLAAALAKLGRRTGLLDADIYGASQPRMLNTRARPATNDAGLIVPLEAHGLKVMSMGFFVEPEAPVIWRGPMVHAAIQQLLRDVDWGDLDVLVIDLPPGTGDAQLSLAQYVPLSGAVIVSTPQEVALAEAKKAVAMFAKTNVSVLGMVENMSFYDCSNCGHREHIFDHGRARAAAADLGLAFLGDIPLLPDVREKADAGEPLQHRAADIFMNIAARVLAALPAERPRKG
jgi:ATP-binding protein involved in chromosome partitioning